MNRHRPSNAVTLALLALGGAACNAVLGIEQAELDPALSAAGGSFATGGTNASGGSSSGGTGVYASGPRQCTTAHPGCRACLDSCAPGARDRCLADPACRLNLRNHLFCLGEDCTGDPGTCAEGLAVGGSPDGLVLSDCLLAECAPNCAGSSAAGICEILCQCLGNACTTELDGGTPATCLADCQARLDPYVADCRFIHCRTAPLQPAGEHCQHALGTPGNNPCSSAVVPDVVCDKSRTGWPCTNDSECCNGTCVGRRNCN